MLGLLTYLLPRQHTSYETSIRICLVAVFVGGLIVGVAEAAGEVVPGAVGEWLRKIVGWVGLLVFFAPMVSAKYASLVRGGYINAEDLTVQMMLIRDYLRGLWPSRARDGEK